jgi:hypothetical protein
MPRSLALALGLFLVQGADLAKVLEKADALLEEAKAGYEKARSEASAPGFVDAGFKLEEARIKYLALLEVGSPEQQKTAADRMRSVNQLAKLIHDGKVAISGAAVESKPAVPEKAPDAPATPATPAPAEKPAAPEVKAPVVDVSRRVPVPDAAKQKDAEKMIRDLFKEQYAKKAPADRRALARTLLDQALKSSDDPVAAWVLCREAQDAAIQGFEPHLAMESIEASARQFDIDPLPAKAAALAALAKSARSAEDNSALAEAWLKLADEQVAADQYEAADKAAAAAIKAARGANDPSVLASATTRSKEISEAKTRFAALKNVLQTLATKPEDPAANLEMGQYLCYVKGSWDLGLRFLSNGSDPILKSLAEKELANPMTGTEKATLADGWWDLAQKETSPLRKGQLLSHAGGLYQAALLDATGLLRIRIEKRLETAKPPPAPPGPSVDLLKMIDPKRDSVLGEWAIERNVLVFPAGRSAAWLQIPYAPPEEYDLKIVATRKGGGGFDFYVGVIVPGGKALLLHIDGGFQGKSGGFQSIDGKDWGGNETSWSDVRVFDADKRHTLLISVRKNQLAVTADGKQLSKWTADYSRANPVSTVPNPSALWVGDWEAVFEASQIQLIPISGSGKSLPHVR